VEPEALDEEGTPTLDVRDVDAVARLANTFFSEGLGGLSMTTGGATVVPLAPVGADLAETAHRALSDAAVPEQLAGYSGRGPDAAVAPHASVRSAPFLGAGHPANSQQSLPWVPEPRAAAGELAYYFLDHARDPSALVDHRAFEVEAIRRDFPILNERVQGRQVVWLDNAATTQKPQAVIDRLAWYYEHENSNIHRGAHELAARATDAYEEARKKVAGYLGASPDEIVFVRGTTEAINLVAQSWGRRNIASGDEVIVSHLEHHANIVPWQQLVEEKGAKLRVIPVDDDGQILLDAYGDLLNPRTRLVAIAHVSNALGTIVPIRQVIEMAHHVGARVLVDGAQSVAHLPVDMGALDPDFFVFSGHKIFAPTGIGALYAKTDVLETMPPWQGGGNMIRDVTFERTTYQEPPDRFEAGTGNIADAIGLGAALDYVDGIGLENAARYEHELLEYATSRLKEVPGLRLIGTAPDKACVLSFVLAGYLPEEVGSELNRQGIAVRAGHHCAQPILRRFGLESTVRPSLALYNTRSEIDYLVRALHRMAADRPAP